MGMPLSSVIANMVMEKLEERAHNMFHSPSCIRFHYVDDEHGIMQSNYIEELIPSIFEYHMRFDQVYKQLRT